MRWSVGVKLLTAGLTLAVLSACGGGGDGGGGTGGTGGDGAGAGGGGAPVATAAISGSIQGFGSIIVDDIELETENTEVEMEGRENSSIEDLREGMVVQVEGSINDDGTTGTAIRVRYEDDLEGPISNVATSDTGLVKTLVIMGQTIIVENGVTRFDNNDPTFTFASLGAGNVGNVVEVSGFRNADGTIQATFIQRKADDLATFLASPDNELEIKGTVSNLDETNQTFSINDLTVDYSGVATFRNLDNAPGGVFADGLLVEVKGDQLAGNTLTATDVEVKVEGIGMDDMAEAKVQGFVTDLTATTFKVMGQLVNFENATFRGGDQNELVNGIKVEVQGAIVDSVLQADTVTLKAHVRFEANADTVTPADGTLTLEGLNGITVMVDDTFTEFIGVADLNGVASENNLKIRARLSGANGTTLVATRLELVNVDPDTRVIIQGTVESFDETTDTVTILEVDVDTSTIDNDDFKDEDTIIGRDEFFNRLAVGDLVKARADLDRGTDALTWNQIQFED
jgi:hypothetical protein